jgi:hypothetical protein
MSPYPSFFYNNYLKRTYALVGESGTGKSYCAQQVAHKHRIDFIIDDGLLIKDNRILAGKTVKEEKTYLAAVKAALFDDKKLRDEVAGKLLAEKWRRILVLGTSVKMVNKIAARLQIPSPLRVIRIEDISPPSDIERALRRRRIEGKHVIPVASTEVKQNYPGIFFNAVPILKQAKAFFLLPILPRAVAVTHGKTDVLPLYSKPKKIIISDWALNKMLVHSINEYDKNIIVKKSTVKGTETGYKFVVTVDIPMHDKLEKNIRALQDHTIDSIEHFTGIPIEELNLVIDKQLD